MIDTKSYKKIIKLLDNGKTDELRKYVASEETKYYISNASKEVTKYLNSNSSFNKSFYGYVGDDLLLCNGISLYLLKEKSILSKYHKDKFKSMSPDELEILQKSIDSCNSVLTDVDRLDSVESDGVLERLSIDGHVANVYDTSRENYVPVDIKNFKFSKPFLGEDVKYRLVKLSMRDINDDYTAIFGMSNRGKCLIIGRIK